MNRIVWLSSILMLLSSCNFSLKRFNYTDFGALVKETNRLRKKPSLKLHLKNGDVYVFGKFWNVDSTYLSLNGIGMQFDINRNFINHGSISVPMDSIALYEINIKGDSPDIIPLVTLPIMGFIDFIALFVLITGIE